MTRIFQATSLIINETLQLDPSASHHLATVLRASVGDALKVFNGDGGEFDAKITHIAKHAVTVMLLDYHPLTTESALPLYLAQGISRGEKMDYTIQKAVELGVQKIIPVFTERCNVKLDEQRREKRLLHWRSISMGAAEQSGRACIPDILAPQTFTDVLQQANPWQKILLDPLSKNKLSELTFKTTTPLVLFIGPEGGFSDAEITLAKQHGCVTLSLGPRILRTETAAVTAISLLQFYVGDLG